jgi:hypothetical protein
MLVVDQARALDEPIASPLPRQHAACSRSRVPARRARHHRVPEDGIACSKVSRRSSTSGVSVPRNRRELGNVSIVETNYGREGRRIVGVVSNCMDYQRARPLFA